MLNDLEFLLELADGYSVKEIDLHKWLVFEPAELPPGMRYATKSVRDPTENLVYVDHTIWAEQAFRSWLIGQRPALVEEWDAAVVIASMCPF